MKRSFCFVYIILILLLISSCGLNSKDDESLGDPFIIGIITDINVDSQTLLVEENTDVQEPLNSGGNKIWLSVNDNTAILKESGGESTECTFDCLQENSMVSCWVTGPVAESYPMQGTARRIVILEE